MTGKAGLAAAGTARTVMRAASGTRRHPQPGLEDAAGPPDRGA
jgi:hypothetical protein